ncbi:MAG TPA: hypothetical protein VHZ50_09235, partial [Puia sp.]|nr:hypothetical protein [Puia sp.]
PVFIQVCPMKKLFITGIMLLLTISLYAQVGMPRELSCTEEAFTFSTSLGAKWKISTPRMGPVETMENSPYDIQSWSIKATNKMPETPEPLLYRSLSNAFNLNYHFDNFDRLKFPDKLNYRVTQSYFSRSINYNLVKPDFLNNFNQFANGSLFPESSGSGSFSHPAVLQ